MERPTPMPRADGKMSAQYVRQTESDILMRPEAAGALGFGSLASDSFFPDSLDNRIRELCRKVVTGEGQVLAALTQLRSALRDHNRQLRKLAAKKLLGQGNLNAVTESASYRRLNCEDSRSSLL
jgi:hypothetical protein